MQMPWPTNAAHPTPALRQATESLPLTDREAEIVMLIGEGLSNRAVRRATDSFRTHRREPHLPGHVEDRNSPAATNSPP